MTEQEWNKAYLEAVHKCALGIKIIRHKGKDFGLDAKMMERNEMTMIKSLSDGVGIGWTSVSADVYDQVRHFPRNFFRRPDVKRLMGTMIPQMKVAGFIYTVHTCVFAGESLE